MIATREMRGHIAWYISGLAYNKRIKDIINKIEDYSFMLEVLNEYFEILDSKDDDIIKLEVSKLLGKHNDIWITSAQGEVFWYYRR